MLKLTNLTKRFPIGRGAVRALSGVDFEVAQGEFFTLLGPSGCGKSTLLRCIAGLERPEGGEIMIGERVVFSGDRQVFVPANRRDVAMVFQSYAIWPHMTVYENVAYPIEGKFPKAVIREKVTEALCMAGIEALAPRPAPQLSGGQQQRVAVARAVVRGAKVVLFDEPLSNLDAKLRIRMRAEFKSLQKRLGFTAIYVTHDQEEALSLSDRIAVMNEGRVIEIELPSRIYSDPKARFTAEFVGSYNLFPGKMMSRTGGLAVAQTALGEIQCASATSASDEVVVGIRPEHIEVLVRAQLSNERHNTFAATITSDLFLGRFRDCEMKIGTTTVRVQMPAGWDVTAGGEVGLYFPPQHCIALAMQ